MNKILLNKNGRNHIKIFPLKNSVEMPEDPAEKIKKCEKIFKELAADENAIRKYYYRNNKKGVLIAVYESHDKIYLSSCLRDLNGCYVTTIYISELALVDDMIKIAGFLRTNHEEIMSDYKNQITEGIEAYKDYAESGNEAGESDQA